MKDVKLLHGDCHQLIKDVPTESVDCILTDPPYLYLKHKLDIPFDEDALFSEFWRVTKPNAFVVIFGRGVSLARWMCKLDALGFKFKEEIVWNKFASSSPTTPIGRTHELCMIFAKGKGKIRRRYIPFDEGCLGLTDSQVLNRLRGAIQALHSPKHKEYIEEYLRTGVIEYTLERAKGFEHTFKGTSSKTSDKPRSSSWLKMLFEGCFERSIMSVSNGGKATHPTQKPIRLLERLIDLTTDEGASVLDPFAGSGATLLACRNLGRKALGFEIDEEYYETALRNLESTI